MAKKTTKKKRPRAKPVYHYSVPCSECGGNETSHEVVHEYSQPGYFDGRFISTDYQIVRCLGCRTIRFRKREIQRKLGYPRPIISIYPQPEKSRRKRIETKTLPKEVSKIYKETLATIDAKANTLAALGLRATVEGLCRSKGINEPSLQKKIDGLATAGVLSLVQAEYLHESRYLGNDAAHELKTPKDDELGACLEIIESLLTAIYILPTHSDRLKKRRGLIVATSSNGKKRKAKT
jgi:hypothetical protein